MLNGTIRQSVSGITEYSKNVQEGFAFVARKGNRADGTTFIEEALARGAKTIVVDRTDLRLPDFAADVAVVLVPECSMFLSYGSAKFAGNPAEELTIIGVTGTNGKTTVSHFIGQLLKELGYKTAIIGTTGLYVDGEPTEMLSDSMTTMPAERLHPILRSCREKQVTHIVLEASSLGLSGQRLAHCPMEVGVFLNIGMDHYAEHGGRESYIEAKKQLIPLANRLVVNEDDPICRQIGKELSTTPVYFGKRQLGGKSCPTAFFAHLGEHNEMNARAAIGALLALGYPLDTIRQHVHALRLPKGRLEKVEESGIEVYVDYAHTPDALTAVLQALSNRSKRVITVFGCGGERDREKRPQMGAVAAYYSSHIVLTSDNPRGEEPSGIILDILAGTSGFATPVEIVVDRGLAIRYATGLAQPGDIVLIAGKGHEQTQQIGDQTIHFCDREEVKKSFKRRNGPT